MRGCGGTGWWCLCSSVCHQFLAFGAVPRISESKNELMTIPLTPSEDGVFSLSQIFCLPSSLHAQTSKVYSRVIFVAFLAKKRADYSVSDRYIGKFLKLVIAMRS